MITAMTSQPHIDGQDGLSRREFVRSVATTGLALSAGAHAFAAETQSGDMLYRTLGRTGEKVSAIGLGGYHIGVPRDESEGIRLIRSNDARSGKSNGGGGF